MERLIVQTCLLSKQAWVLMRNNLEKAKIEIIKHKQSLNIFYNRRFNVKLPDQLINFSCHCCKRDTTVNTKITTYPTSTSEDEHKLSPHPRDI